jgi:hypothetical protein
MADTYSIAVTVGGAVGRRSANNINPTRPVTGEYQVSFPENINNWYWLATLAPVDSTTQVAGFITVELESMTTNTLRVRTWNANAAVAANAAAFIAADRAFHLHVRRN